MTEQPLDLGRVRQALRTKWLVVAAIFLVGLVWGVLFGLRNPPTFVARSGVLLPPSPVDASGVALRNIQTEIQIAQSAEVLDRAGKVFVPPTSARLLKDRVQVRAISPDILEVRTEAKSRAGAIALANAVAQEFVTFSSGANSSQAEIETAALRTHADELERRIGDLNNEIASGTARMSGLDVRSPEGLRQAALLDSLRAAQVETSRQLATLNTRIAEAQLKAELARRGMRVYEPASASDKPVRPGFYRAIAIGAFAGLLIGVVTALAVFQRDRRLRTLDQITDALGAPVLASLPVGRRFGHDDCKAVLRHWEPNTVELFAFKQAFTQLCPPQIKPPVNLVIVALPGDHAAVLCALKVGVSLASVTSMPADLIVAGSDEMSSVLSAACATVAGRDPVMRRGLRVRGSDDLPTGGADGDRLTVTLIIAGNGPLRWPAWGKPTVMTVAVSSGKATGEELASVALACHDAGHPVRGVWVANPDSGDHTTGRLGQVVIIPSDGALAAPASSGVAWPDASANSRKKRHG